MPLYDYKCKKCNHIFEVQQKMADEPLKECPQCKGEIHRLISAAGIVFKGSGFHVTDYKKESKPSGQSSIKKEDKKTTTPKNSPKASSPDQSK